MTKTFEGVIKLDVRDSKADWTPYELAAAPKGAPNVLIVLYDAFRGSPVFDLLPVTLLPAAVALIAGAVVSLAREVTFTGGQVTIPINDISDGELHRYSANLDGKEVRFLVFKKPEGKVVTVLDACQICGPVGFYKSGNQIICKNCSAPINAQSMGQPGGCNPIPLKSSISSEQITISQADLSGGAASSAK